MDSENKKSRTGRIKGCVTLKNQYSVKFFDIFKNEFISIGDFKTFKDISDFFATKKLFLSPSIIQNIYCGRTTFYNLIEIKHL